jgi:hypothetical protein
MPRVLSNFCQALDTFAEDVNLISHQSPKKYYQMAHNVCTIRFVQAHTHYLHWFVQD